jgi:hypothetical protein
MRLGDPLEPSHPETGVKEELKAWIARPALDVHSGAVFLFLLREPLLRANSRGIYVFGRAGAGELSCLLHPQLLQKKPLRGARTGASHRSIERPAGGSCGN